jgi:5'-methylthioadenosine phosphorylase
MEQKAQIGIFGGSGLYSLFDNAEEADIDTPYGKPSDKITIGEIAGRKVAFLPRHGRGHKFAPHIIPYKANLWAFKGLGVEKIIAPTAAGSLQPNIKPGEFVVCDQFVDRTYGRAQTFYDGPKITHVSCADPYCPEMRKLAVDSCRRLQIPVHEKGTVVVIEGPRFSTKAESRWYQQAGFEVINMTQYPEVALARELAMCYTNIALITDYNAGLVGQEGIKAVEAKEVVEVFNKNISKVKELVMEMVKNMSSERVCECKSSLANAGM